jgi:hypothetical protein
MSGIRSEHFNYSTCPDCGAPFNSFSRETNKASRGGFEVRSHVHGGSWETLTFACGRKDQHVPNFHKISTAQACGLLPESIARERLRKEARTALATFIRTSLTVDDGYRRGALESLGFYDELADMTRSVSNKS